MSLDAEFYETLARLGVVTDYGDPCPRCGERYCDEGMPTCHLCMAERPNP
jgi:hypothetical protein